MNTMTSFFPRIIYISRSQQHVFVHIDLDGAAFNACITRLDKAAEIAKTYSILLG